MKLDPVRPLMYLADHSVNSVVVFNNTSSQKVSSIYVGSGPWGLDVSSDHSELYVALKFASHLAVVNLTTLTLSRTISLSSPAADVAAGRQGRAYVTSTDIYGYPRIVDTNENKEIVNITAVGSISQGALARVTPDGKVLFIAETGSGPDRVIKFNVTSDVVSEISASPYGSFGQDMRDVALSPDGSLLYVAPGYPYYYVQIVNHMNWSLIGGLQTGPYANSVNPSQSGGVIFATHATNEAVVFNASNYLPIRHLPLSQEAALVRTVNNTTAYVITSDIYGGNRQLELVSTSPDTTPPVAPALLQPADGSTTGSMPWLDWSEVDDPSGVTYALQLDDNPDFSSPEVDLTLLGIYSNHQVTTPLPDGSYRWRVRAVDGAGNVGAFSQVFTFTVDSSLPSDGTGGYYSLVYLLTWTPEPFPGATVTMVSTFKNNGTVPERVTALTLTFDFGSFSQTSGLPLVISVGRTMVLNMSIVIPLSVSIGPHTGIASVYFQYLAPNSTQWVTPARSPLVVSGSIDVVPNFGAGILIWYGAIILARVVMTIGVGVAFLLLKRKGPSAA